MAGADAFDGSAAIDVGAVFGCCLSTRVDRNGFGGPATGPPAAASAARSSSSSSRARFLGLHVDQALPVGDGDLVVVGMDFAEGEEAVAVAAILDEGRLQAGLYPDDLGEVDVALELPLGRCLDVEIF